MPEVRSASKLARRLRSRRATVEARERRFLVTTAFAGVAVIAWADYHVADAPLGFLYLLPITLVSMTGRARYAFPLVLVCTVLREALGPFERTVASVLLRSTLVGTGYFFVSWLTVRRARERFRLQALKEAQHAELIKDLALAAETQRLLLPHSPPTCTGLRIGAEMFPARIVGGDYYDVFSFSPDRVGIAIGDVSGKGVAAGMLMPALGTALRMGLEDKPKPDELLSNVDRVLYAGTSLAKYATLFYAEIDGSEKQLAYCNAGHPPAILLRGRDASVDWLEVGGPPLGLLPGPGFDKATVQLQAGDVIVMYTDGAVDAEDRAGEPFGRERLVALVQRNRQLDVDALVRSIKTDVDAHSEGQPAADDCTIVVVKVL